MNRISFLNRGYAFKGLLAVMYKYTITVTKLVREFCKAKL